MNDITNDLPNNGPWPEKRTRTESIVVHHSATSSTTSPEAIADYHVKTKGMPHIQYHALVYWNGATYQVNEWDDLVYHAGCGYSTPENANNFSIGVCLIGDFTDHVPPDAQIRAFKELYLYLNVKFDAILEVVGHKECYGVMTQCPGDTWPSWKNRLVDIPIPVKKPLTKVRWNAEETVRDLEQVVAVLETARTRLVDDVITPLYKLEGGQ